MQMQTLPLDQLPGTNTLFIDFCYHRERVREFYPPDNHVPPPERPHRPFLWKILKRQNETWGNNAAKSLLAKLQNPGTYCIVTGQQVGLLTGPLYTIWKALTAIKAAEKIEQEEGLPCVPIFWMATEDHNWHEVMNFALLRQDLDLVEFSLQEHFLLKRQPTGTIPVSHPEVRKILLRSFKEIPLAEVKQFYGFGTLTDGFARTLLWLLKDLPILLVDPSDPEIKQLAGPFFARFFERKETLLQLLNQQNQLLKDKRYPTQVKMEEEFLPLFYIEDDERRHVPGDADGKSLSVEKLSPSALLRPLFQDYIFPTLAYIGGPAEIAYFAQLHPWYPAMDQHQPRLMPRASMTLIPPATRNFLESRGLQPSELFLSADTLVDALLDSADLNEIRIKLSEMEKLLKENFVYLKERAEKIEKTLRKVFETSERKIHYHLEKMERKAFFAAQRRNRILSEQVRKAKNVIYPGNKLQERYLNVFSFARRLPEIIMEVYSQLDLSIKKHWWIPV